MTSKVPAALRTPQFLYFDLGNVLLWFDHDQGCRQMAEVSGVDQARIRQLIHGTKLGWRHEIGELSNEEFYEAFCREFDCRPDYAAWALAGSAIFRMNWPMHAVVAQLSRAGHRLGMLSNTCHMHWDYFADGRYRLIPEVFEQVALSFRLRAMKPDPNIYLAAAKMAGVSPNEVFYVDDIPANVEGALAAGFDAVQYTTTPAFVAELHKRGVEFNY
jgi:FMN phosphatase YigB (HAD superfamily)